jgi:hypothetical protein
MFMRPSSEYLLKYTLSSSSTTRFSALAILLNCEQFELNVRLAEHIKQATEILTSIRI